MANIRNSLPKMTDEERAWFDDCPKGVLFAIARKFAVSLTITDAAPQKIMMGAWEYLYDTKVVVQKPSKAPRVRAKK